MRGNLVVLTTSFFPVRGQGVSFDPLQVLGFYVWPAVGAYWLITTAGISLHPFLEHCSCTRRVRLSGEVLTF